MGRGKREETGNLRVEWNHIYGEVHKEVQCEVLSMNLVLFHPETHCQVQAMLIRMKAVGVREEIARRKVLHFGT